jgi:hypothetical protein
MKIEDGFEVLTKEYPMKKLIILAVALSTAGAFAMTGDLNSMKMEATSKIDKEMTTLKSSKNCINNASTMEAFKACKFDMSETKDMQKMENMDEMKKKESTM